jgi:hypothetical protein
MVVMVLVVRGERRMLERRYNRRGTGVRGIREKVGRESRGREMSRVILMEVHPRKHDAVSEGVSSLYFAEWSSGNGKWGC